MIEQYGAILLKEICGLKDKQINFKILKLQR